MDAASGQCAGCLRTVEEITRWSSWDDAQKRKVWEQIELRLAELKP
jgi:predicted Fe-S protein YdhL (DUF1289 family)